MSTIVLLGLLLFAATRQLMVDFCWRMATQDGKALDKTVGELEKCIAIDKDNALFRFFLGRTYQREGLGKAAKQTEKNRWVRKSIDEFHKAIELNPSNSDYHFHLGISYGSLAYPPPFYWEVIQGSFERTLMLNPTNLHYLYSIGIYYLDEYNRLRKITQTTEGSGLSNYKKYVAMSKKNYQFYFRKLLDVNEEYLTKILEKCFLVTKKYADLKAFIGNTASSRLILARFLNGKGMWEKAKNQYMMAITLEPLNPIYYAEFANAFSSNGDFENAITWWQKQKKINPQDEAIYLSLNYGFMRLNRFDDALQELRDLIQLNPEDINYQVKLMRTLLDAGRIDEAINEYRKVMQKKQIFSKSMYKRILDYQKKGDYAAAARIFNESLTSALNR